MSRIISTGLLTTLEFASFVGIYQLSQYVEKQTGSKAAAWGTIIGGAVTLVPLASLLKDRLNGDYKGGATRNQQASR